MSDQEFIDEVEESEDLFGFAELFSAPEPSETSAAVSEEELVEMDDSKLLESSASFEESDCLFNFDELGVEAELEAEAEAEAEAEEDETADVLSRVPELAEPEPEPEPITPAAPAAAKPAAPLPSAPLFEERPFAMAAAGEPARGFQFSLSPRSPLLWILIASISLNFGVIGFTWRVSGKMTDQFSQATHTMLEMTQELQANRPPSRASEPTLVDTSPIVISDPDHEHTFARVQEEIDRGEYAIARKRLYALLSISDRMPPELRDRIESTAQFMLADITMQVALGDGEDAQ